VIQVLRVVIAALCLVATTTFAEDVPLHGRRIPLPPLHAEPDPAGGRLVDAKGREVILRGVNVNALAEYWQYGSFPTTFPFDEADADRVAGTGWNVVRLLLSWSRVEPAPGTYDEAYLDAVEKIVRLLARRNVYTLIDFHQDAWGATLAARPDEVCNPPLEPAFGWDGAPGWATFDGGAAHCFTLAREVGSAVLASFSAFFSNTPGPGGVGIRDRYASMVGHVAARFAGVKSVIGYDLMNEPNAFSPAQVTSLAALYADSAAAIRAAEAGARHGFSHLVVFEPSALWSDFGTGNVPAFAHDANVVFSPHIYRGGISGGPIQHADFERARADAAVHGGAPVVVGEWGSDPRRASDPADVYFNQHQAFQDEFRFSATLWAWRESCGDPHKAGDIRAGNVPYVWGEFEFDCTTNAVTGPRQDLVDQLTRGFVRAAPGRLGTTAWDPAAGRLTANGADAPQRTQLVAYWPARLQGAPRILGTGLRHIRTRPAWGGVYVVATATGGAWSLIVEPESGGGSPSGAFVDR
jgi:endoglycosylceramidase